MVLLRSVIFWQGRYGKEGGGIISSLKPMLSDDNYMCTALHLQFGITFLEIEYL